MRRTGVPRAIALPAAAFYALLPHYSTDRFWMAAMQAPVSIVLYLISLLSGLRAAASASVRSRIIWACAAVTALVAALLCYEVVMPLTLLSLFLWVRQAAAYRQRRPAVLVLASCAALLLIALYKASVTARIRHPEGWLAYAALMFFRAITPYYRPVVGGFSLHWSIFTNYFRNGLLLPWNAWKLASTSPPGYLGTSTLAAAVAGALLFWYVRRMLTRSGEHMVERREAGRLLLTGVMIFFLGYAIFLTNANIHITPTGIGNRTAIAAALGVSLSFAAGAMLIASVLPVRWRALVYSSLVALMGAGGCFIVNQLGNYWAEAYQQEIAVIRASAAASPGGPAGKVVLLDGVCLYLGPAPVFESAWDFPNALALHFNVPGTLSGNVVSPGLAITPRAFVLSHYGTEYRYPYGPELVIYNAARGAVYPIPDFQAASHYFETINPDRTNACPASDAGLGVKLY
jgi:hypothetical protein